VEDVLVYGASGHAKVVLDILKQSGRRVVGCLDDDTALWDTLFRGVRVLGGIEVLQRERYRRCALFLAIGDNKVRRRLATRVSKLNRSFAQALHPSVVLGTGVRLGEGVASMAHVAINSDSTVGRHAILNTGCTVDHDCVVGPFAHLSPGVHLAGNVRVGEGTHLGVGVSVIPGISIGAGTVVGAGAAVVSDLPQAVTAVGVPARVIAPPGNGR